MPPVNIHQLDHSPGLRQQISANLGEFTIAHYNKLLITQTRLQQSLNTFLMMYLHYVVKAISFIRVKRQLKQVAIAHLKKHYLIKQMLNVRLTN